MAGNQFGFLSDAFTGINASDSNGTGVSPIAAASDFIGDFLPDDGAGGIVKGGIKTGLAFATNPFLGAGVAAFTALGLLNKEKSTEEQIDARFNKLVADHQGIFDSILAGAQQSAQAAGRKAIVSAERAGVGDSGLGQDAASGFEFGAFEKTQTLTNRIMADLMQQARADIQTRISDPKDLSGREKFGLAFGAFESAQKAIGGDREKSKTLQDLLQGKKLSEDEQEFVSSLFKGSN